MLTSLLLLLVVGIIILFSIRVKMRNNYYRAQVVDPISSPLSEALGQLLAIAGGIYLSLVMLVSFLGIDSPEKIYFWNVRLDPLALLSFVIALVQPFVINWLRKVMN